MSQMETIMQKRQQEMQEHYEAQWNEGKGSHHPDYDPKAAGPDARKATRETEELLAAIVKVSESDATRRAVSL